MRQFLAAAILCCPVWCVAQSAPPPKKLLPPPVYGGATGGLTLASGWDNPLGLQNVMASEFARLLKPLAPPDRDLSPAPDVEIYPGISYLMKLQEARTVLGKGAAVPLKSSAKSLTPGFPAASMSYYDTSGKFDEDFGHAVFVADAGGHVVALQFTDNAPKMVWLTGHTSSWSTFNFVQTRRKGVSSYLIAHKTKDLGSVIRLDSELIDANRKSRERIRLFIPKKFASIVVSIIESSQK